MQLKKLYHSKRYNNWGISTEKNKPKPFIKNFRFSVLNQLLIIYFLVVLRVVIKEKEIPD